MRAEFIALVFTSALASAFPAAISNDLEQRDDSGCPTGFPQYTVQSGDSGYNISIMKNVSTITFLDLPVNHLTPPNYDIMAGQTLCLPPSCPGYVVQRNDDCAKISAKVNATQNNAPNGVSLAEYKQRLFFGYNPGLENPGCMNLKYGTYVCLGKPDGDNHPMPISNNP